MQRAANESSVISHDKGACPDGARILCLPEEVWQNIALNLSAAEVLSLLCVNQRLRIGLGQSANLWKMLSNRDGPSCYEERIKTNQSLVQQTTYDDDGEEEYCWRTEKYSYLFRCHKTNPSKCGGGVHWYPVRPYGQFAGISDREGHVSCVLSRHAISYQKLDQSNSSMSGEDRQHAKLQERIVVITGGFSNDDSIYLIHAGTGTICNDTGDSGRRHHWDMKRVDPMGRGPSFAYGATLTALPTLYSETAGGDFPRKLTATMRAIRFGGFRAGGYSNETSQVVMLTVKQDANKVRKRQRRGKRERQHNDYSDGGGDGDEDSWSTWEWHWNRPWEVGWSNITTTGMALGDDDEENSLERDFLSRAYHTSTLLMDRYLVVIGGMKSTGSILNEAVLDTKTWTWIGNGCVAYGGDSMDSRPNGRHGHSVVLDDSRNRLVLFGGGSGSDLLRSGEDNSEVWELQLGDSRRDNEKFAESFPWKWKKLHEDSVISNDDDNDDRSIVETTVDSTGCGASKLTPSESLCLGRCHHGIKISRDTVLMLFGSGRPSTNGLLAYDLKTDDFFRQQQLSQQSLSSFATSNFSSTSGAVHVKGILPKPRFTGIAAFLEEDGYIITHGGYCSQDHDTIGTIDVLDLAPKIRGRLSHLSTFDGLAIDDRRESFEEVTDVQAERGRRDPDYALQQMLQTLMNTSASERQDAAGVMLNEMNRGERPSNGQSLLLMTMIANGSPLLMGNENEDEDLYTSTDSD